MCRTWSIASALATSIAFAFAGLIVSDAPMAPAAPPDNKPAPLLQTIGVLRVELHYERTDRVDESSDGHSGHTVDTWIATGHLMQRVMIEPSGDEGSIAFSLGNLPAGERANKNAEYSGTHTNHSEHHDKDGSYLIQDTSGSFDVQCSDGNNADAIHVAIFSSDMDDKQCLVRFLVEGNYTEKTQIDGEAAIFDPIDAPPKMVHSHHDGVSQALDLHAEHGFEPDWPADYGTPDARKIRAMFYNYYGTFPQGMACSGATTTYSPKGGWTVTYNLSHNNPNSKTTTVNGGTTKISGTETITLRAKLTPGDPPAAKMTIAPNDATGYDNWMPIPASDDPKVQKIYGDSQQLSFTATIKAKDPGRDPPPGTIDFYLRNVSHNAGKCENDPRPGGGDSGSPPNGLRFAATQPSVIVDPNDPTHAYTSNLVTSATVIVEATDTGAYGRLSAESQELGLNAVYERTNQLFVPVPRDDDGNHIAYAWAKQQGINGKALPATSDDEEQPYPKTKGDGLSIYDQYRGFVLRLDDGKGNPIQKHQRIDIKSKNVFVYVKEDDAAAALIRKSVLHFGQITGFTPHFIYDDTGLSFDDGQVGKSPYPHWLNYNSDPTLAAEGCPRQYAVWIMSRPAPGPNVYGRTVPIPPFKEDDPETPKNVDYIGIYRDNIKARFDPKIAAYPTLRQVAATNPNWYSGTRKAWDDLHAAGKISDDFPAIAKYMSANESTLIDQLMEFSVMHEMGHATGVQHHHLADALAGPEGQETTFFAMGNADCPTRYWGDDLDLSLLEFDGKWNVTNAPDGTEWKFCDDECVPEFHLKD